MQFRSIFTALLIVLTLTCAHADDGQKPLQENSDWYTPEAENLAILQLDNGNVIIELAPFFAPNHVQHFREQINQGHYDEIDFYRVIEGFVAQAGPSEDTSETTINGEFERLQDSSAEWLSVQSPALLASNEGYLNNFPAARDDKSEWLVHCPNTLAMARSSDPNSASNHFYIVLGHAPRHLDRNMTIFGRVIQGMEYLQRLPRGNAAAGGVIPTDKARGKINSAQMFTAIDAEDRPLVRIQRANGAAFAQRLQDARQRNNDFFIYKGNGALDICYYPPRVEVTVSELTLQEEKPR